MESAGARLTLRRPPHPAPHVPRHLNASADLFRPPPHSERWPLLGLFVVLLAVQLPAILNPGYFSHDELQWWARADVPALSALPWMAWTDLGVFQYRPLTFNLWLVLSYACAAAPPLMHAAIVGLGSVNAVLLARCLMSAGTPRHTAFVAALVFALSPYVAYVHGWVGTLADLLTLLAGLLALNQVQRMTGSGRHDALRIACVAALTGVALVCKESAIVLPLLLLPALYRHPRPRAALAAIALSAALVAIYLFARLPVILSPPAGSERYAWAIADIPRRLAEYLLFPFLPPMLEVGPTLAKSPGRLLAATACLAALLASLGTLGWRWPAAWLAMFVALVAPVLILPMSYGQYAYLASAAAVGIAAPAWTRLRIAPKAILGLVAAVAVAHGIAVMRQMHAIGAAQHAFYADLLRILPTAAAPLRIDVADESDRWMALRFVSGVPTYRGVAIEGRVLVDERPGAAAQWVMARDGHLAPAER